MELSPWEANRRSASQEIPRLKVHYRLHKSLPLVTNFSPPLVSVLSQIYPSQVRVVTPCVVVGYQRFRGPCCHHNNIRRHNPEGLDLSLQRRESPRTCIRWIQSTPSQPTFPILSFTPRSSEWSLPFRFSSTDHVQSNRWQVFTEVMSVITKMSVRVFEPWKYWTDFDKIWYWKCALKISPEDLIFARNGLM